MGGMQGALTAYETQDRAPLSAAAAYVGELLTEQVPALRSGALHIVAIARRPGVLSKIAISGDQGVVLGDAIARLRDQLDGERVEIVPFDSDPRKNIAYALGLPAPEFVPMLLLKSIQHAHVFLGEIDLRGMAGWRNLNVILASQLTGWRIRLLPIAQTAAWQRLERARLAGTAVPASVVAAGMVEIYGLFARLSGTAKGLKELDVRVTKLDADEGRITVTDRLKPTGQLRLPLKS